MLEFKEQGIGVHLEVICTSFNEESILDLFFEDDPVKVDRLSILTWKKICLFRPCEVVRSGGRRGRLQEILLESAY